MTGEERVYAAIDLKSFYASVECHERGLDPLTTHLVVADTSRTEKTICLAVSPSLKAYGIPGRARLFEVNEAVRGINAARALQNGGRAFAGSSSDEPTLSRHPELSLDFIAAVPQMRRYEEVSAQIYGIYLRFVSPEDIHVYSIDEVFLDLTRYLPLYGMDAHALTRQMIAAVLQQTGITATAGIAPNLYLAKVAMDVVAKHIPADQDGVRIAELTERSYRELLWNHRPLTDFWRIGRGISAKLERNGMYTMGDVAERSLADENSLFRLFGVNAEYLIDHAWGREPVTIADIRAYRPQSSSLGSGQVLMRGYAPQEAMVVILEMARELSLSLLEKHLVADRISLFIGYDKKSAGEVDPREVERNWYGQRVPRPTNGTMALGRQTSSERLIVRAVRELAGRILRPDALVRRISITALNTVSEDQVPEGSYEQMDLFTDYEALERERQKEREELSRERRAQEAVLELRRRFGKNAVVRGADLVEGATQIERNGQIGGHKA